MNTSLQAFALACLLLAAPFQSYAGFEVPGEDPAGPIVLEHGTIHTMTSETIEDGILVIENGKITRLGQADGITPPEGENVTRIDITGKHVYPGLIDADTTMGLVEIDSIRATKDMQETGSINPNVRGGAAFNPDSEMLPVARAGGVLFSLTAPRGGTISGRSTLMRMEGWTAEDMTMVPTVGMHVNWPSRPRRSWHDDETEAEQLKERSDRLKSIRDFLEDVRAYAAIKKEGNQSKHDAKLDTMIPVIDGEIPMFVHANAAGQIQEAIAFGNRESLKIVIVGGLEAPYCADLLKRHDIPVIVTGTHRLPRRRHADYDEAFRVPARLKEAGVQYCLAGYARFSASLVQNLAHQAGSAAAFGLDPEEAVKSITIYPAKILGVDDLVGSLSAGKEATLIVADGDILEVTTTVEHAYMKGRAIDLNNRHKRLYSKWKVKYERQGDGK